AEKSYGIHVGKLAGLPPRVIKRATQILEQISHNAPSPQQDLPLFSSATDEEDRMATGHVSHIEERLQNVDIDALSPKDALDLLYELRELL
ncbi:MAG: hypothetical protein MK137_10450, partial [Rickettsiales bacterium]|nr:hypothetical protein [Rickettsiales bacterium]